MKRTFLLIFALFAVVLSSNSQAATVERSSTIAQRRLVNVTVYNGGTGLIHDRRRVTLNEGLNRLAWRDVSASMDRVRR
jgi:hypothetical protein